MKVLYFMYLLTLTLLARSYEKPQEGVFIQNLNSNWRFKQAGSLKLYQASVPGTVHLDLIKNGFIEDPYYRNNVNDVQWIENKTWDYISNFDINTPHLLDYDRVQLVFEGLDTHATVFLNDAKLLEADNMFRTWIVDVKQNLKPKSNLLKVRFYSTVLYDAEQIAKGKSLDLLLPSDFDQGRIYSRKAAYHFGWDWGPRLVTCGIWRPVYLVGWNNAKIQFVQINQKELNEHVADLEANIELIALNDGEYEINIMNPKTGETYYRNTNWFKASEMMKFLAPFKIANPRLWWVRNFGEPYLYTFLIKIIRNGKLLDQKTVTTGLRTVQLVRENDEIGQSFYFKLNGQRVFAKGGNYIPLDVFLPRVTRKDYETLLKNAIEANYNFIRVWGGGTYEDDKFYEICDREGILLWQDFMFGNGMYPAFSEEFVNNIKQEVIDNVKRLRNHPSIVLWCGNNEVKNGWEDWGYQQSMNKTQLNLVSNWYKTIFIDTIPLVLKEIDPSRPYLPTSPELGYGHPESYILGDNHYYGVWVLNEPIENYASAVGRFMSEYGMQGLLSLNSLKKFTLPEDLELNSTVLLAHEKGPGAYEHLNFYLENYYKPTKDFESYLYTTQILQKFGIQTAIEGHRRAKPRNMGTLMWQLNDVWPSFSWSAIDFYGTWKAVHYMVKKKFQDVLVSIAKKVDSKNITHCGVHIVSEKLFDFSGSINFAVKDLDGTPLFESNFNVNIPKDSSKLYLDISLPHMENINPNRSFIQTRLNYNFDERVSEAIDFFVRPLHLDLKKPEILIVVDLNKNTVTTRSNTLLIGTYLYVDGVDLHFDDNYFDLAPNILKTVKALNRSLRSIPNIDKEIKILHLYNSYSHETEPPKIQVSD